MTFFNVKLTKSGVSGVTMDEAAGAQANKAGGRAAGGAKKIPPRFKNKPSDTVEEIAANVTTTIEFGREQGRKLSELKR